MWVAMRGWLRGRGKKRVAPRAARVAIDFDFIAPRLLAAPRFDAFGGPRDAVLSLLAPHEQATSRIEISPTPRRLLGCADEQVVVFSTAHGMRKAYVLTSIREHEAGIVADTATWEGTPGELAKREDAQRGFAERWNGLRGSAQFRTAEAVPVQELLSELGKGASVIALRVPGSGDVHG